MKAYILITATLLMFAIMGCFELLAIQERVSLANELIEYADPINDWELDVVDWSQEVEIVGNHNLKSKYDINESYNTELNALCDDYSNARQSMFEDVYASCVDDPSIKRASLFCGYLRWINGDAEFIEDYLRIIKSDCVNVLNRRHVINEDFIKTFPDIDYLGNKVPFGYQYVKNTKVETQRYKFWMLPDKVYPRGGLYFKVDINGRIVDMAFDEGYYAMP